VNGRKQAFLNAVQTSGGTNATRIYALMQVEKPDALSSVFGDDDATPDEGKMKSLIKQVQVDYPEYFGTSGAGSPSNSNGVAPTSQQQTEKTVQQMTAKFGKM
jgi:hypothetical protein